MENILDYVHLRKDIDFKMRPLNRVDILVLNNLSYVNWDGVVNQEEISLHEACEKYLQMYSEQELLKQYSFSTNMPNLVKALSKSMRYVDVKIKNYKRVYSDEDLIQFSALTIVLPDQTMIVSFGGTDGSITGWKENLLMTYKTDIPCQILAKEYLEEVIENIPETSFWFGLKKKKVYPKIFVTGHSKGGNLAMYAYLKNPQVNEHVTKVFSFDGSGFIDGFWDAYEDVDKITNYIPKGSIIGRLLNHKENVKVMDACKTGLAQHDTFMWSVDVNDFVYLDDLSHESDDVLNSIEELLFNRSLEEREHYTNLIGEFFNRMHIYTIADLSELSFKQALSGLKEIRQLNSEEIKFILEVIKLIVQQSGVVSLKGWK